MDREAWWATVREVAKNRTRVSDLIHTTDILKGYSLVSQRIYNFGTEKTVVLTLC